LIRVFNYIEKVTAFNMQDHLLEAYAAFSLKSFIFIMIPFIVCHKRYLSTLCAICQHVKWFFRSNAAS